MFKRVRFLGISVWLVDQSDLLLSETPTHIKVNTFSCHKADSKSVFLVIVLYGHFHCVKRVQIQDFFCPVFSCIFLYSVNLRIQSKYKKIRTRIPCQNLQSLFLALSSHPSRIFTDWYYFLASLVSYNKKRTVSKWKTCRYNEE